MKYDAILFDLDGTLIDSAPDLVQTLNILLDRYGRERCQLADMCQYVSYGSTRLLEVGFAGDYPMAFPDLRRLFLTVYQDNNTTNTVFFPGVTDLLDSIEGQGVPWGIITNKPTEPTVKIAEFLALDKRADAIVCGDTLPVAKPDPSPIILACEMIGVDPGRCVYLGDCDRDIEAGRLAGMATIACAYGYIVADDDITQWGADYLVQTPEEILPLLQ